MRSGERACACSATLPGDAHDLDVVFGGEQARQGIRQELVIVDEQDPDRLGVRRPSRSSSPLDVSPASRTASRSMSAARRRPAMVAPARSGPGGRLRYSGHADGDARTRLDRRIRRPGAPARGAPTPGRSRLDAGAGSGPGRPPSPTASIDEAATDPRAALAGADLIVLAAPPPACLALLDDLAGPWRSAPRPGRRHHRRGQHQVGDRPARDRARTAVRRRASDGRPRDERVRGRDAPTSSSTGRGWWCPARTSPRSSASRRLARAVGARPIRLAAADHDAAVAGISHLPLDRRRGPRRGRRRRAGTARAADWPTAAEPGGHRAGAT